MNSRSALLVALLLASACACGRAEVDGGKVASTGVEEPNADVGTYDQAVVVLLPDGGQDVRIEVEVAQSEAQRRRGLMYRQHLLADAGMLFVFETEEVQSFWMRNTVIPLDIIFIRQDLTVAGVAADAKPLTTTSRRVDTPSMYVLEVNGGIAAAYGIKTGTRVRFEGLSAPPGHRPSETKEKIP